MNYRSFQIILRVKHFDTNRERCEVLTGYLSSGPWPGGDWANTWHLKPFNVHGSVLRNNILVYNSNKMHKSQSLFNLTIALHVSGVTITHLQEHKTTAPTASGNYYTILLSSAIVEELDLIWVCCGWRTSPTTHSNQFQLFHDSSRQQYGVTDTRCCSYSCFVLLEMGDGDARNM